MAATDLVPSSPFLAAAASAVAQAMAPYEGRMASSLQSLERMAQQFCAQGNANLAAMNATGGAIPQRVVPGGDCGCGGGCKNGACSLGGRGGPGFYGGGPLQTSTVSTVPGAPPFMVLPACYQNCKQISECLAYFLEQARPRFDEWSWLELAKSEVDVVHFDTNVGAGPTYQVPAVPLGAGQASLQVQNDAQQLPWEPGLIKISAEWTGTKAPSLVEIRFYSGLPNITGITSVTASGLILIGKTYKLADFECADDCYLMPWPTLFGCVTSAIPDTRRLYCEVSVGAVGAATLSSINLTVLKRETRQCNNWMKKCSGGGGGC